MRIKRYKKWLLLFISMGLILVISIYAYQNRRVTDHIKEINHPEEQTRVVDTYSLLKSHPDFTSLTGIPVTPLSTLGQSKITARILGVMVGMNLQTASDNEVTDSTTEEYEYQVAAGQDFYFLRVYIEMATKRKYNEEELELAANIRGRKKSYPLEVQATSFFDNSLAKNVQHGLVTFAIPQEDVGDDVGNKIFDITLRKDGKIYSTKNVSDKRMREEPKQWDE